MKLKPFKEMIAMSKEKIEEALAPMRARQVKAQAELEMAKIDEKLITLETTVQEICSQKTINFDKLIEKLDESALLERRQKQFEKILGELFPEEVV